MKNFKIEALPDFEFFIDEENISPVDVLALSMQDYEKFEQLRVIYKYALENTLVKVGEKLLPVKTANKEVYMPVGINKNGLALHEICTFFMREVIGKTFQKSSE